MMTARSLVVPAALACALGLASCGSPPGPVQPEVGPKSPGILVIDPALKPYLDVPEGEQVYRWNDLGFLEYNVRVRNKGSQAMALSVRVDTFDPDGVLLEEQSPTRFFIDPASEKTIQVQANDKKAKKMRVQIAPAK